MNFKKFLPFEDYTLTTKLKVEEVSARLSENICPKRNLKTYFLGNTSKPYEGYIVSNNFEMSRIIGYRNSCLPVIKGFIYTLANKTYIKVEMKIRNRALIAIILVTGIFIMLIVGINMSESAADFTIFNRRFLLLLPVLIYLVNYFAFKFESKKSKRFLAALLEAEETNS